ncbi:tetratricopeptide repeat protein [Duganella callida]|uniref:Tetratricopeptide repeat protein n=1 Tax=Duganella callida TaxID=2561932 RepID=A0A4Y9SPK2_9BURK|nr:tetratricopeptide repeat protein [Duganella callida]TFW27249.1 tetratricopeptide repeat protein [Duganella callida]
MNLHQTLLAAALALALACPVCRAQDAINATARTLIDEGNVLLTKGQGNDALVKFIAAAKADPESSLPPASIAHILFTASKLAQGDQADQLRQKAEAAARYSLSKHPGNPIALEVLRMLSEEQPLQLHQPTPEAAKALHEGEVLFSQQKLDEARAQYERAATLDPLYSAAWIYAGDCLFAQKKYAEAEQRFRKGVEVEPLNAQGWRFLADALALQGKPGPAEGALMNGIAAQPSQMPNWLKLNQLRSTSGFPLTPAHLARKTTEPAFAAELAAWRKALQADAPADEDGQLKAMRALAKADQLEAALLLLLYRESWRAELEAWKQAHPEGVRKFIDAYQLRP